MSVNNTKEESKNVRDLIKQEYAKCLSDPIYFMFKYVKVQNPVGGARNFELYDFQKDALNTIVKNNFTIVLKGRQLGLSTLVAAYTLWLMTFFSDKNILIISVKQDASKEVVTRIRFANDKLPVWLKVPCVEDNRLSLRLKNGSHVNAASSASTSGRSAALSLLIIDEAAFITNAEDVWASAFPTLSTGGNAIIISTPNGVGNWFHKMWCSAEAKENNFATIKLPWYLHPKRDQTWRDVQAKVNGEKKAAQENDCDFLTSGGQVIPYTKINEIRKSHGKDPIERRGANQDFWIWERVDYSKTYILSADCARGDGADYSAFHIIDTETLEQVAEYKGKLSTTDYGNLLVAIATEYNNALLVIESNSIGWATIQQVINRGYQNLFYSSADLIVVDIERTYTNKLNHEDKKMVPGFSVSSKNRPLIVANLETISHENQLIIHSHRLLDELSVFIWNNGRAEAMTGYNDDLVMSYALAMWVRGTALRIRTDQQNYANVLLTNIRKQQSGITGDNNNANRINTYLNAGITQNKQVGPDNNPWKFRVGGTSIYDSGNEYMDLRELI